MDASRCGRASLAPPPRPAPRRPRPAAARAALAWLRQGAPRISPLCPHPLQARAAGAESLGPRLGQPWSVSGLQLRRVLWAGRHRHALAGVSREQTAGRETH